MVTNTVQRIGVSAAIVVLAIAAFSLTGAFGAQRAPLLVDQSGHAFTLAQLRGTPLVVTFVSAHCHDACPLIDAQTAHAVAAARAQRFHVRFVTITLDPEHDSLADMRRLAQTFDANPKTWIVAGGSRANVHAVMNVFHVIAQRGRSGFADVHTTFVYLVDTHGNIRETMLASTEMSDQIVAALRSDWVALTQ